MKLSNQAIGSIMLALQIGILNQKDITDILADFEMEDTKDGLVVINTPELKYSKEEVAALGKNNPSFVY